MLYWHDLEIASFPLTYHRQDLQPHIRAERRWGSIVSNWTALHPTKTQILRQGVLVIFCYVTTPNPGGVKQQPFYYAHEIPWVQNTERAERFGDDSDSRYWSSSGWRTQCLESIFIHVWLWGWNGEDRFRWDRLPEHLLVACSAWQCQVKLSLKGGLGLQEQGHS